MEAGCPIVPMAISGTENFLHDFPRRTLVSVTFLRPLHALPDDTAESLTERVMLALASALPEPLRGVYMHRAEESSLPARG
jgi:1-acyl-sn-glycerol-3-phosphate acyltransferase